MVLDQQRNVVADLGIYYSQGAISALSLDLTRFVPELYRQLVGRDDRGGTVRWNGASDSGQPAPNGYYRLQVQSGAGGVLEAEFYLEHQPWSAGRVLVGLLPRASEARIVWNYSESVSMKFSLYNLAGELVWQARGVGSQGDLRWGLRSASGEEVSNGIYLLHCVASSLDGALEDEKVIKLAVVR